MAYNTGNPIGSTDARDLYDNAQNMDKAVNQRTARWSDRFGVSRPSWSGMSHYNDVGEYAADILITGYNEVFRYDGEFYRAAAATVLPYTTTGSWSDDGPLFVPVGDAVLRHDMAYEADFYIGYYRNAINCNQYGGLEAAVADADTLGKIIVVTDAQAISDDTTVSDRILAIEYGAIITIASGKTLTINVPFSAGLYQVFAGDGAVVFGAGSVKEVNSLWFGLDGEAIQKSVDAAARYIKSVYISSGTWNIATPIQIPAGSANAANWGISIRGAKPEGKYQYLPGSTSTVLKATSAIASIINNRIPVAGAVVGGSAASYYSVLKEIVLDGNNLAVDGYVNGYQDQVENVSIIQCTNAGILFGEFTNSTRISNTTSALNAYGIYISGDWQTTSYLDNCQLRQNTLDGAYIAAGFGLHWSNVIFESNGRYGLNIYRPVDATNTVSQFLFTNCYWEANTDYAIIINGATSQYPRNISFERASVNSGSNKAVNISQAQLVDFTTPYINYSATAGFFTIGVNASIVKISGYDPLVGRSNLVVDGAGASQLIRLVTQISSASTSPGLLLSDGVLNSPIQRPETIIHATSANLATSELYGTNISNQGQAAVDVTLTLPAVITDGKQFILYVATSQAANFLRIGTTGAAGIYLQGTADPKAWIQQAAPVVGSAIMFTGITTSIYGWVATPLSGTWTTY